MKIPNTLAESLVEELLAAIHKYDETMLVATVLGCLEIVKAQLLQDHMDPPHEGDDE